MSDIKVIFDECQEAGQDKNATIMRFAVEGGLDITKAVREYNRLAKDAGLILGTKERTTKVTELLQGIDVEQLKTGDVRRELTEQIAEDFDISTASATAHIKKFCEENEIELPSVQRNTTEDLIKFVSDSIEAGKERAEIIEGLQVEMGYTKNSANSAWSKASRELGLSTGGSGVRVAIEDTVKFIREHEHLPRTEAVDQMVETLGYAKSTANSFFTYLKFAQEFARQEIEAAEAA